jgi:para-aminobenzoate synthetase component 1
VVELALEHEFHLAFDAFRGSPYAALLDSAQRRDGVSRWSIIAADPRFVLRARLEDGRVERVGLRGIERIPGDPFEILRSHLTELRPRGIEHHIELPLIGGAIGYLGYEAGGFIESLPEPRPRAPGDEVYDLSFAFHDLVLIHDHLLGRTFLSSVGRGRDESEARAEAERHRDRALDRLAGPKLRTDARCRLEKGAQVAPEEYARWVGRAKDEITAGNIFEVTLSHAIEARFSGDPWLLYRTLRRINPAPFAAYLELPEAAVVCSSPERFLSYDPVTRRAESRPIKGTRRRGRSADEDSSLHDELEGSIKDRAENMMIVDLVRNDLGRVSDFSSVRVPSLMAIEAHPTVHQMVSTIEGRISDRFDAIDLLRACFPGGSMTGAPKIEAMKVIRRLEPVRRGIYSGSIGYLDYRGGLDLNIVIRSIMVANGRATIQVGGAVVADSEGLLEHRETIDKAAALLAALEEAACGR